MTYSRSLMLLTTRPFKEENEIPLEWRGAHRLFRFLVRRRWNIRVAGERNYVLWMSGRTLSETTERLIVLPDAVLPDLPDSYPEQCVILTLHRVFQVRFQEARARGEENDRNPLAYAFFAADHLTFPVPSKGGRFWWGQRNWITRFLWLR